MAFREIIRRRALRIALPGLGALLVAYFAYHAIEGSRGLFAYLQLVREIRRAEITHDLIEAERDQLDHRVRLLRPTGIDPDMLDEQARQMLNFGRPDEVVVMLQRAETRGVANQ